MRYNGDRSGRFPVYIEAESVVSEDSISRKLILLFFSVSMVKDIVGETLLKRSRTS